MAYLCSWYIAWEQSRIHLGDTIIIIISFINHKRIFPAILEASRGYGLNVNQRFVKTELKEQLRCKFIRDWKNAVSRCSKCSLYKETKKMFRLEPYLCKIPKSVWKYIIKCHVARDSVPWLVKMHRDRTMTISRSRRANETLSEMRFKCTWRWISHLLCV